jgi:hypothetical protein
MKFKYDGETFTLETRLKRGSWRIYRDDGCERIQYCSGIIDESRLARVAQDMGEDPDTASYMNELTAAANKAMSRKAKR